MNGVFKEIWSGFRIDHDTDEALVKIMNDLLITLDSGLNSMLVLLDLVRYLGSSSHTKVNYGLPEGSLLGQILFRLYMVPLGSIIKRPSIHFLCMILIFIYSR